MSESDTNSVVSTETFAEDRPAYHLGLWLGRHHAFGLIGTYATAGDAYALSEIRTRRYYRQLGISWEKFCDQYVGVSHKTADAIIARWEEFGDIYFDLSQIIHIPVREYRILKRAILPEGVVFDGEVIPITQENTARLIDAIYRLRVELGSQEKKNEQLRDSTPFTRLEARMNRCLGEVSGKLRRGLDDERRQQLAGMLDALTARIQDLRARV